MDAPLFVTPNVQAYGRAACGASLGAQRPGRPPGKTAQQWHDTMTSRKENKIDLFPGAA